MSAETTEPGLPARKRILVVDDHPLLRRGVAALIRTEPDLDVCAEAATAAAALDAIREHSPDLVIVDITLEGPDGLGLIKEMKARYPEIPALVLSMHDEAVYAERALRAGARGYVTKQQLDDTLLAAIRRVLNGEMYMSEKVRSRFAEKFLGGAASENDSPLAALTDHELEVFRLIGQGQSTRQIAHHLHRSVKTIESYREHIKQKLTLGSGAELVRRATLWVEADRTS